MKIYRISGQMDIYNTIRKKMPPPSKVMDDGRNKSRMKDMGGDLDTDIPDLEVLKNEAKVATEIKGHTLGNWEDSITDNQNISVNHCVFCDKAVIINDRPKPNQIDIGGEAILEQCEEEENV